MPLRGSDNKHLLAALKDIRGEARFEAPLKELTSLRIGGPAEALVVPHDMDDLSLLVKQAKYLALPLFVLGGTNLLIQDGGLRGIVVSLARLTGIYDEEAGVIYAEAGVRMPILLRHAMNRSLSGLEWAAGIPGTVGGAVVMNAGTHLGEMKDVLQDIQFLDSEGTVLRLSASSISFGYRTANLPEGVVAGAWLKLNPTLEKKVKAAMTQYLQYRKSTQPLTRPNAGSIFKNPQGGSAGKLIEEAGLKGLRIGDAQISQKHANFIVNVGEARSTDVLLLIRKIQQTVFQRTGIMLELELKVVGDSLAEC